MRYRATFQGLYHQDHQRVCHLKHWSFLCVGSTLKSSVLATMKYLVHSWWSYLPALAQNMIIPSSFQPYPVPSPPLQPPPQSSIPFQNIILIIMCVFCLWKNQILSCYFYKWVGLAFIRIEVYPTPVVKMQF